jgi:hypothetical protein
MDRLQWVCQLWWNTAPKWWRPAVLTTVLETWSRTVSSPSTDTIAQDWLLDRQQQKLINPTITSLWHVISSNEHYRIQHYSLVLSHLYSPVVLRRHSLKYDGHPGVKTAGTRALLADFAWTFFFILPTVQTWLQVIFICSHTWSSFWATCTRVATKKWSWQLNTGSMDWQQISTM